MSNLDPVTKDCYFSLIELLEELVKFVDRNKRPKVILALGVLTGQLGQHLFHDIDNMKAEHAKWFKENPEFIKTPNVEA